MLEYARAKMDQGGEIVQVQGGHIVRSIGRKDRHSKVCTSKGPRDRRVRLSAHTAIQFYDVQDRLGYNRPSEAVDWLIKKAKSAIDELQELPSWDPTNTTIMSSTAATTTTTTVRSGHKTSFSKMLSKDYKLQDPKNIGSDSFLPPPPPPPPPNAIVDDTIKSFFPLGAVSSSTPPVSLPTSMQFITNNNHQNQDLRLSLHSFQESNNQMLLHQQHHQQEEHPHQQSHEDVEHVLLMHPTGNNYLGFDDYLGDVTGGGGGGGGGAFVFSPPTLFGQGQFFTQREPLQSSNNMPLFRACVDPAMIISMNDDQIPQFNHQQPLILPGIGIGTSGVGGFTGFHIPARIQGEAEEHNKPSSASSDSCL